RTSPPPTPRAPAYTYSPRATGVKTCAGPLTTSLYRQRNSPVLASTPTRPLLRNCTYCLRPPPCMTIADAYPAWSPPGTADFQMSAPVFLFSATSVASAPPGVKPQRHRQLTETLHRPIRAAVRQNLSGDF